MNKIKYVLSALVVLLLISNVLFYSKISNLEKDNNNLLKNITTLNQEKLKLGENYQVLVKQMNDLKDQKQKNDLVENLTPEETVKKFIEADMMGARIGGDISGKVSDIKKYIDFAYEGDSAMIIKDYKISGNETNSDTAKITVEYTCAGGGYEFDSNGKPIGVKSCDSYFKENNYSDIANKDSIQTDLKNKKEIISFELKNINNQWKIISPSMPPHISIDTFINHTKTLLKNSVEIDKFSKFFAE